MMKPSILPRLFFMLWMISNGDVFAQTITTINSGNWSDPTIWSGGAVPAATSTVIVNHPITIDQNITITTGNYTFNADVIDVPGGTNYTLTSNTNGGRLDITAGTTTFGGTGLDNSLLFVRNGATLILGALTINNNADVTIEAGGVMIINGNLTNNNNGAGFFTVAGTVFVNGNYSAPVGSVEVSGNGNLITSGTIDTNGSSEVFGSTTNCTTGPCSGQNLCSGFTNTISADQILCPSQSVAQLTGNAVGSATYQWESNTTGPFATYSPAAGTNNAQNYTPGLLTQTTWFRRSVTSGGCTGISVQISITVHSAGGWLGTTADWNTASNWCSNAVPTSTTDVSITVPVINPGSINMPTISAAANCRDLTIGAGASVTISGSNTLSIYGSLANAGTFATNSSTVTLAGSTMQTIGGSSITFNNLIINNSLGTVPSVNATNFITVTGTLTMTQGTINLNSHNFTLGSSAASPGTLVYTAGRMYGSSFTRWINTSTVAIGNVAGLYPVGSSTDYRPFYVGFTSSLSTGGTIRVKHNEASTTTVVSFVDGASTVLRRQDSYWNLAVSNGMTSAGNIFLARAEGTGFGTVADVAHLRLTRIAGVVGTAGTNGGTTSNPQVNRTGLSQTNMSNDFYFGSVDLSSPLPVTLLDFSGRINNASAELSWSTASERNFNHFEIEKMYPDGGFESIGSVSAKGTSFSLTKYSFRDIDIQAGSQYYRLKIVDRNNSFEYSNVVHIQADEESAWIFVYPNPITARRVHLDVLKSHEAACIIIYDQLGRILLNLPLIDSSNDLEFPPETPSGILFMKVSAGARQEIIKLLLQ